MIHYHGMPFGGGDINHLIYHNQRGKHMNDKYGWSARDIVERDEKIEGRKVTAVAFASICVVLLLIYLFSGAAWAQSNPVGVSTTDYTTSGLTFIITGGTRPITVYRKPPASSTWQTYRTNVGNFSDLFTVSDHNPGQCFDYSFRGNGMPGGSSGGTPSATYCALPLPAAFNDVPGTYWALTEIYWMRDNNITSGCGSGNYCPELTVTRAQMAVFLYNVWKRCVEQNACEEPVIP